MATEVWKPVVGFEGFYEVSNCGRVKSLARTIMRVSGQSYSVRERILRFGLSRKGYRQVNLSGNGSREVHRLVLMAFVGPCPTGKQARHLNGIKIDNRLANLQWGTAKENQADRIVHGTSNRGEKHGFAKLTTADILFIRNSAWTHEELAREFDVQRPTITKIKLRYNWAHVP